MISLSFIFWTTAIVALISFWWQSDQIKHTALTYVDQHCKRQSLQLLDQTMVLKGVWLVRDQQGSLRIRRRYAFEFTSTGAVRSQGVIVLLGRTLQTLELEAHILPNNEDILH